MENKTLVSIILPAFNEEENLAVAVQKIAESVRPITSHFAFELLFVNDGSSDKKPTAQNHGKTIGMRR